MRVRCFRERRKAVQHPGLRAVLLGGHPAAFEQRYRFGVTPRDQQGAAEHRAREGIAPGTAVVDSSGAAPEGDCLVITTAEPGQPTQIGDVLPCPGG